MTPKEQRFVEEFLIDLDPKAAALRAGYSATTAAKKAFSWVGNSRVKPHVFNAVQQAKAERTERVKMDSDAVLERLVRIMETSIGDFIKISEDGLPSYNFKNTTPEQIAAIGALQIDMVESAGDHSRTRKIKLTLPDKLKTLELIGKHVNVQAFKDKLEIGVDDPLAELMRMVDGRTRGIPGGHSAHERR